MSVAASHLLVISLLTAVWTVILGWRHIVHFLNLWFGRSWSCADCDAPGYGIAYSDDGSRLQCEKCYHAEIGAGR